MKKSVLGILLILVVLGCNKEPNIKDYKKAVMLTIENSMAVANFNFSVDKKEISSTGILLPINQQIVETVVDYRSLLWGLTDDEKSLMRDSLINKYINGKYSVFALFFINEIEEPITNIINFNDSLHSNILLEDEFRSYKLIGYNKTFNADFMNGITSGYLIFENFRKNKPLSYSVKISNLNLTFNKDHSPTVIPFSWSASFDNSELEILSLVKKGLSEKEIRKDLGINTLSKFDISKSDMLNILSCILTIGTIFL